MEGDFEMDRDAENPRIHDLAAAEASAGCVQDANKINILAIYDSTDLFRWGYGVHELWSLPAIHLDKTNQAMARFKLLLDESPTTKDVREGLKEALDTLSEKRS